MKRTAQLDISRTRVASAQGICPTELKVLREVIEYQGDREVIGSTLLDAASVGRQVHLWTLSEGGEHLLLLLQAQRFCYWEASRAELKQLRERATDWLTEPPLEASLKQARAENR